jgi:hypothetical protein
MDQNEIPHDPRHERVESGASKMISEPMVCRHKACTYLESRLALSPNGMKRASTWASSHTSTIGCVQNDFWAFGTFGANHAPILHWHKHCLQTGWIVLAIKPRHLGVPSGVYKMISEPMVRLAQTVQLSCTDTNTVSKWTKMRFHMTHIT